MQLRKLGRSNLEISPIFLGGNVFGWNIDDSTSFSILDAYVEAGGNSIDTADVYSAWAPGHTGGESETVIGKWLKARGNRDKVIIATKVGSQMGSGKQGLSRQHIFESVEDSLKRLQTDVIDLYQAHRDDANTPLEETLQAFNDLVKQGKVRSIGASNYSAARLSESLAISQQQNLIRYESLQPPYNLVNRSNYEDELEPLVRKEEIGVITYSSLASGFLTGKYQPGKELPQSVRAQGVQKNYLNAKGWNILKEVEQLAQKYHVTPSQIALAWILARPGVTAPIASATTVDQVRELIGATEVRLNTKDIEQLNSISESRRTTD